MDPMHTLATSTLHFRHDRRPRLAEAYSGLFTLVLQLRDAKGFGDPMKLREEIMNLVKQSDREAELLDLPWDSIQDARFAVIAFIDEVLIDAEWLGRQEWDENPLQLQYFNITDAGSEFFDRLDRLKKNAALHHEELEVYYLCMSLGFKGALGVGKQHELTVLKDTIFSTLNHVLSITDQQLSPAAIIGQVRNAENKRHLPNWLWATVLGVGALLFYLFLRLYASRIAQEAMSTLQVVVNS